MPVSKKARHKRAPEGSRPGNAGAKARLASYAISGGRIGSTPMRLST
jgi:hypothetical protein